MASKGGGVRYHVTGVKEIQRAYRLLPKAVAGKVVRQSIRKALKPVLEAAKREAPVSHPSVKYSAQGRDSRGRFTAAVASSAPSAHTPGQLKKAIKLRARLQRRRGVIALDVRVGDGDFKGATYYAAFVEFGTKYIDAAHFLQKAHDSTKESAAKTAVVLISAGVDREWKNL